MANKPIQSTDIASADVFTKLITDTKALMAALEQSDKNASELAKSLQKVSKGLSANNSGDLQKAINAEKLLTEEIKQQGKRQVEKELIEKRLNTIQKQRESQTKREKKALQDLNSVYVQQNKQLAFLNKSLAELAARGRTSGKVYKGLLADQQKLRASLEGINSSLGRNQFAVGRYENALKGLRGTANGLMSTFGKLGVTIGTAFVARNIGGIVADFSQAQGDLLAISGKTEEQLASLTAQAKQLGETTQFSATQITLMQVELAKLGFTVEQIEQSTEPVANFAAATGVELPRAAALAGSALRAFQLEATEMERVVSTLGVATTKSALDFSQLENGLSTVAPVANAFGFTIEETTALLGSLSNAGFDASSAATATRNILLNLADANGDLAKALGKPVNSLEDLIGGLKELDSSGIDLAGTLELTDVRSVAAFNTFLKGTETITELKDSITDANQELEDMAEKRLNTVGGQLTLLSSAWEGYILGADGASGASNTLKSILGFLAKNLSTILSVVVKVGAAWLTYKSAVLAINLAEKANVAITALRTNGLKALFTSQTAANASTVAGTAATKGLNTVMKLNPIGLLITGLVALATQLDIFSSAAERAAKKQQALNDIIAEGNEIAKAQSEQLSKGTTDFLAKEQNNLLKALAQENLTREQKDKLVEKSAAQIRFNALQEKKALQELIVEGQKRFKLAATDNKLRAKISGELEVYAQRELELEGLIDNSRKIAWNWYFDKIKKTNSEKGKGLATDTDTEKVLTGLAALQKELSDLEKLRSDRLVENAGVIDGTYIAMTAQTRELENQIAAYKLVLDKLGEIQEAEKRGGSIFKTDGSGVITTEQGKSYVARDGAPNAKTPEELVAEEKQRIEDQKQLAQNLTDVTIMLIDKRIEALDREAEAQKRNYDEAKQREQEIIELRKAGAVNTAESLAFEREAQAKALKEQEKIAKKKQRLELTNSAINMFNSAVQNGNGNPLGKTMADVSALVGFIRTLPAFWSGTDTTVGDSLGTQISSGRDGILARVDKSEMILNKGKVDKLAGYGITTTDGILDAIEGKRFVATSTSNRAIVLDNSEVVAKLDKQEKLLQQIASRPHESTDIEKISNAILITQQLTQGNKVTNSTKVIRTK